MLTLPLPAPARAITTFSGLAVVVALLVCLPWLRLASETGAEAKVPLRVATERPPETPPGWLFTIHVVESEEQKRSLFARYPSPTSDGFIVITPGQETDLQLFRAELDAQRAAKGLPPAVLDDLRAAAAP